MRGAGGPSPPRMQMRRQRAPRRSIAATMRCQTHDALVVGKVRMNANDWTAILEPEPSMATRTAFHNRSAHVLRRSRDLPRRTKRAEEQSQTPWQALAELKEAMQSALPRPARMWHRPARGSHYLHLRASAARRNTIPSPACVQAAHAKPRQKCSKPSSQSASQSVGARAGSRGLTLRSSGAPTACHQGPPAGTVYIFCCPGLASCRCRPLSSNVRPQHTSLTKSVAIRMRRFRASANSAQFGQPGRRQMRSRFSRSSRPSCLGTSKASQLRSQGIDGQHRCRRGRPWRMNERKTIKS